MYKEFYLMRKEPFDSHPSPELFYKSSVHQNAWSYLLHGIQKHEPILLLAGDYGAGKTLLFLKLVKLFKKKKALASVCVSTPTYNFAMVLEKIIERLLNISPGEIDTTDESRLQQVIYEYFENKNKTEGKKEFVYVVIDDAQEFSYSFVNKLRIFASYNFAGYFPIRIVLFAHHSFLEMLTYKKMAAFGQRIKRIYHLNPLGFEETREYIYYRLIHSGATGTPVFDDEAIGMIQTISKGNPRLINNICDNCLLMAGSEKSNLINTAMVYEAMEQGNLTGIQQVQKPDTPIKQPRQTFQPPSQEPASIPTASGFEGNHGNHQPPLPQDPGYDHAQVAPQAYPHPQHQPPQYPGLHYPPQNAMPSNSMPNPGAALDSPMHQPREYEAQIKPKRNRQSNIGPSKALWSQYGKVISIVILALIVVFLVSYLFNQYSADKMFGMQIHNEKIIKAMPAHRYVIEKDQSIGSVGGVFVSDGMGIIVGADIHTDRLNHENRYVPVLLTGNLGS